MDPPPLQGWQGSSGPRRGWLWSRSRGRRNGKLLSCARELRLETGKLLARRLKPSLQIRHLLVPGRQVLGRPCQLRLEIRLLAVEAGLLPSQFISLPVQGGDGLLGLCLLLRQPLPLGVHPLQLSLGG